MDLLPTSQLLVGRLLYGGTTVPGMRIDGERLVGSRAIMRRLDELAPSHRCCRRPASLVRARARGRALGRRGPAERWPRRLVDVALVRRPMAMESYVADAKLPLPRALLRPAMPLTAQVMALRNKARDDSARADLAALPRQLERIDGWIAEGLLGGDRPNAADLQIGSTIRLLLSIGDLRPLIEGHPAARLTDYFPPMVGEVRAGVLPAEWLRSPADA